MHYIIMTGTKQMQTQCVFNEFSFDQTDTKKTFGLWKFYVV